MKRRRSHPDRLPFSYGLATTDRVRIDGDRLGDFTREITRLQPPDPSILFAVFLALSMAGLGLALRTIPVGTGYAIWVGIGAVGTALIGMIWLGESTTLPRILCLVLIVAGVVGLKIYH